MYIFLKLKFAWIRFKTQICLNLFCFSKLFFYTATVVSLRPKVIQTFSPSQFMQGFFSWKPSDLECQRVLQTKGSTSEFSLGKSDSPSSYPTSHDCSSCRDDFGTCTWMPCSLMFRVGSFIESGSYTSRTRHYEHAHTRRFLLETHPRLWEEVLPVLHLLNRVHHLKFTILGTRKKTCFIVGAQGHSLVWLA